MSGDLPPPGGPPLGPPPPPGPTPRPPVNPYATGAPARYHWAAILGGVVLGFMVWVFMSFIVIIGSGFGEGVSPTANAIVPWVFLALIGLAVALIVWPPSRRLGQGFILGSAIGMIVAGGLCMPIVIGA